MVLKLWIWLLRSLERRRWLLQMCVPKNLHLFQCGDNLPLLASRWWGVRAPQACVPNKFHLCQCGDNWPLQAGPAFPQPLADEYEHLLVWWISLIVLDLGLCILDEVGGLQHRVMFLPVSVFTKKMGFYRIKSQSLNLWNLFHLNHISSGLNWHSLFTNLGSLFSVCNLILTQLGLCN